MSSVSAENKQKGSKSSREVIIIAVIAAVLLLSAFLSTCIFGRSCSLRFSVGSADDITVSFDEDIIECVGQSISEGSLTLDVRSVSAGSTLVEVSTDDGITSEMRKIYVHPTGVITLDNYYGRCRGDILFPAFFILTLTLILIALFRSYRRSTRVSLCRYSNAWLLGVIIFVVFVLLFQLLSLIVLSRRGDNQSVLDLFRSTLMSARLFTTVLLPIAVAVALAISISNLLLMKNEGICLGNMLGFFLGVFLCVGTVAPNFIYPMFDSLGANVHNMSSPSLLLENFVEDIISIVMAYFECVLIGTSVSAVRAARHIPAFDKDFILIHGCQIAEDGGLTKLLKSRADRAVEFARMQKKETGKGIVFVPSGGKGDDEVISEAEAIRRYLISIGIPDEQILAEDRSVNTDQNIRFSYELIRERSESSKIAFSTTNYHVFRTGCMADEAGIIMEGIGARTKVYFWINAFIREFIAALHYEKRAHIKTMLLILASALPIETAIFISNIF